MTIGSELQDAAVEVILEFATEQGQSTLQELTGEVYDPALGVNVPTYEPHLAYMAGDEMVKGLTEKSFQYQMDNMAVFIAGNDVTVDPKEGDIVEPIWLSSKHKIIHVDGDMYEALWVCHVQKKPELVP